MKILTTYIGLLAALIALLTSCNENAISSIPDWPVSLQLNLTAEYPTFKNSVNQHLLFETRVKETDRVGYGGILVYTGFDEQYYAWDMACPYEADKSIKVYPNGVGEAVCEKCGSIFNISYGFGFPTEGPSKQALKKYRTSLSGDQLFISR